MCINRSFSLEAWCQILEVLFFNKALDSHIFGYGEKKHKNKNKKKKKKFVVVIKHKTTTK